MNFILRKLAVFFSKWLPKKTLRISIVVPSQPLLRADTRSDADLQTLEFPDLTHGRDCECEISSGEISPEDIDFLCLREKRGLSRKQLAKAAGVSEKTLIEIEKDWKKVGLGKVYAVSRALGYEMEIPKFGFQDGRPSGRVIGQAREGIEPLQWVALDNDGSIRRALKTDETPDAPKR